MNTPTPVTLNIYQLQLQSKLTDSIKPLTNKGFLTATDISSFKQDMLTILNKKKVIKINNQKRNNQKIPYYFCLMLTKEGISLIEKKSIKKSNYFFSFTRNQLEMNQQVVSTEFIKLFIKKIETIAQHMEDESYTVTQK